MVSLTSSLLSGFGSGLVVENGGFFLNDRMRYYYLDPADVNSLQPGKRVRQTINPAMALRDGKPFLTFGTPGRRHAAADAAPVLPERRRVRDAGAAGARAAVGDQQQLPRLVLAACGARASCSRRRCSPQSVRDALAAKGHKLDVRDVKGVGLGEGDHDRSAHRRPAWRGQPDRRQLRDGVVRVRSRVSWCRWVGWW